MNKLSLLLRLNRLELFGINKRLNDPARRRTAKLLLVLIVLGGLAALGLVYLCLLYTSKREPSPKCRETARLRTYTLRWTETPPCSSSCARNTSQTRNEQGMQKGRPLLAGLRALTKPANAKIALNKEKSGAILASCVSCTCSLRSLTSM